MARRGDSDPDSAATFGEQVYRTLKNRVHRARLAVRKRVEERFFKQKNKPRELS